MIPPPLCYVAGAYTAEHAYQVEQNIAAARAMGMRLAALGAYPVIPHSNTAHFDGLADAQFWYGATLELMRRCDAVVFLPSWTTSKGSAGEHREAERLCMPLFGVGHVDSGEFAAWVRSFQESGGRRVG